MLLIATDEAGYGPKLGPLAIVATAWQTNDDAANPAVLTRCFAPLQTPVSCGELEITINDSKQLYSPTRPDGFQKLHAAVSAAVRWSGSRAVDVGELLTAIAPWDLDEIQQTPWLRLLASDSFLSEHATAAALTHWRNAGVEHMEAAARIITARRFNRECQRGINKADLLTESTLRLVRTLLDRLGTHRETIQVFCDRHGGRRYYGAVLQHVFPDARLQIEAEGPQQSCYRLEQSNAEICFRFCVGGDRFAPVAMSSIYAKYLREAMMQSLNRFFADRHRSREAFRGTAGYPVDADRFLQQILPIRRRERICDSELIRCR